MHFGSPRHCIPHPTPHERAPHPPTNNRPIGNVQIDIFLNISILFKKNRKSDFYETWPTSWVINTPQCWQRICQYVRNFFFCNFLFIVVLSNLAFFETLRPIWTITAGGIFSKLAMHVARTLPLKSGVGIFDPKLRFFSTILFHQKWPFFAKIGPLKIYKK